MYLHWQQHQFWEPSLGSKFPSLKITLIIHLVNDFATTKQKENNSKTKYEIPYVDNYIINTIPF